MVVTRAEISEEDKWDISSMYQDLAAWQEEANIYLNPGKWGELQNFQGRLGESAETMKSFFDLFHDLERKLDKLYTYVHLGHDQETTNEEYKDAYGRAQSVLFLFSENFSWVEPEILALKESRLQELEQYYIVPVCSRT